MLAALGIITGCLVWATIVATGLGVLLVTSRVAYSLLRCAAAVYLAWIGF